MTTHNKRVLEMLNRYIGLGVENAPAPHYAVMLNGEWGCGKSYFIREKWLKNFINKPEYSVIVISLFGMSSVDAIKEKIAQSLIFRSTEDKSHLKKFKTYLKNFKSTKFGSVIDKGVTNFFGIGFGDVIGLLTKEWLEEHKAGVTKLLIFDDLERANMGLEEIFGFISEHLENSSLRVVFISNDNRIGKTEKIVISENIITTTVTKGEKEKEEHETLTTRLVENNKDYLRIREKVIGETVSLEVDFDEALNHFFLEMSYSDFLKDYLTNKIKEIMKTFEYNNLRAVRQSLMKLRPLIDCIENTTNYRRYEHSKIFIDDELQEKNGYLFHVINVFLIVYIQKTLGFLTRDEIGLALSLYVNQGMSVQKYKEKVKVEEKEEVYSMDLYSEGWNVYIPLKNSINCDFWVSYIWNGELDNERIDDLVKADMVNITPIEMQDKSVLLLLNMNHWDLTMEQFNVYLETLIRELNEGIYNDVVEIIAAYALLVKFEKQNILIGIEDIDTFFDAILNRNEIQYIEQEDVRYRERITDLYLDDLSYRGYQIPYSDNIERVSSFFEKVKMVYISIKNKNNSENVNTLLGDIISGVVNIEYFYNRLSWRNNEGDNDNYLYSPVLASIEKLKLWQMLDNTPLLKQRRLISTLKARYGLKSLGVEEQYLVYESERQFLVDLLEGYEERLKVSKEKRDNKTSMYEFLFEDASVVLIGFDKKIELGKERMNPNETKPNETINSIVQPM